MILYLVKKLKDRRYYNSLGLEFTPTKGKHRVILNLNECQVISLDLPPLKGDDLRSLIKDRLSSYYPHSLEDKVWDYYQQNKQVRVFITNKETVDNIHNDLGHGTIISSSGLFVPWKGESALYSFETPCGHDLFFTSGDCLDQAFPISNNDDLESFIPDFIEDKDSFIKLEPSSQSLLPLFRKHKKKQLSGLLIALPFLIVGLLTMNQYRQNQQLKLNLVEQEILLSSLNAHSLSDNGQDVYSWEDNLSLLKEHIPVDLYQQINLFYPLFIGRAEIISLSLKDNEFQIKAIGRETLILANELNEQNHWKNLSVRQIKREGSEETFTITGSLP